MEDRYDHKELQLLPLASVSNITSSSSNTPSISGPSNSSSSSLRLRTNQFEGPSLDLQLSVSLIRPIMHMDNSVCDVLKADASYIETLRCEAAEQLRLASIEKAYAERMRELSRREMELAQSDFARARVMWETAKEEVEKAERMKERSATIMGGQIDSTCMEITCQSCSQRFQP